VCERVCVCVREREMERVCVCVCVCVCVDLKRISSVFGILSQAVYTAVQRGKERPGQRKLAEIEDAEFTTHNIIYVHRCCVSSSQIRRQIECARTYYNQ